jgi:peptide/nickel transport system substrate-binding protein
MKVRKLRCAIVLLFFFVTLFIGSVRVEAQDSDHSNGLPSAERSLFTYFLDERDSAFLNNSLPANFGLQAADEKDVTPAYGGTVIIGMKGDFDSFNELNASDSDALQVIGTMLFMTLTRLDENLQIVPHLAESWQFSDNGKALTYKLRQDVKWTDGQPTTSKDVLFTYQMAIHPEVAYPASSRFDLTESVDILGPYTIRFRFKHAYPDALFDTMIPILPEHILSKIPPAHISQTQFNRKPLGNGPFRLVEWKANQRVVFEDNPDFALGRPYLEKVIFAIIPDESVLLTNLMTGAIDIIPSLSALNYQKIQSRSSLNSLRYGGLNYTFIAWNCSNPDLSPNVRKALTHAIDKREIIATLMEGYAIPAKGPFLPSLWAFNKDLDDIPFDQDLARNLLKSEGIVDTDGDGILDKGNDPFELVLRTNAESQLRRDIAVMVQAQLKQIGVKINVEVLEFNQLIEQIFVQKNFDALLSAWGTGFSVNPTDLFHSKAIEGGYNFVSYKETKIDQLIEEGRSTIDHKRAKLVWDEFQRKILADCPYTFLFIQDRLAAYNKRIKGVRMDVRGFLPYINQWYVLQKE